MTASTALAAVIRNELLRLGWTQGRLADEIGVSQKHLSQVMTAKAALSAEMAMRLEGVLNVSAEALMALYLEQVRGGLT